MGLTSVDLNFLTEKVRKNSAYLREMDWNANCILYAEDLEQTRAEQMLVPFS